MILLNTQILSQFLQIEKNAVAGKENKALKYCEMKENSNGVLIYRWHKQRQ